jgi:hypothetical protein
VPVPQHVRPPDNDAVADQKLQHHPKSKIHISVFSRPLGIVQEPEPRQSRKGKEEAAVATHLDREDEKLGVRRGHRMRDISLVRVVAQRYGVRPCGWESLDREKVELEEEDGGGGEEGHHGQEDKDYPCCSSDPALTVNLRC